MYVDVNLLLPPSPFIEPESATDYECLGGWWWKIDEEVKVTRREAHIVGTWLFACDCDIVSAEDRENME